IRNTDRSGGLLHPGLKAPSSGGVRNLQQRYTSVEMQHSSLAVRTYDFVRPPCGGCGNTESILKNLAKDLLTTDADLAIDARHASSSFVRSVHERVVEAKPAIERVSLVETFELVKIVSR